MTPHFLPTLVNPPFGDPGVYVDFLLERRAILFDLGDLAPLGARKLLRVSDVCISHTHIDHFIGFDLMLRIMLGRDKEVNLYGPPGILRQVENRLASYSWNLIGSYPTVFTLTVTELHPDGCARRARFCSRNVFVLEHEETLSVADGVIMDEGNLSLRAAFLEHSIPCLAYAFREKRHVNFMKNRLAELGAPVGPWLSELKRAVLRGDPDDTPFTVPSVDCHLRPLHDRGSQDTPLSPCGSGSGRGGQEPPAVHPPPGFEPLGGSDDSASHPGKREQGSRTLTLGELKAEVLQVVPGEKIAYVTDTAFTPENRRKIVDLVQGADYLFIEAVFLHRDADRARDRAHLTARQAGELAREAGVQRVIPFHFSPRHLGAEDELRRELNDAFQGT